MRPIPLGARGSFALTVAPQHLASVFKDSALPPVLATPVMILVMENAALDAIRSFLEPARARSVLRSTCATLPPHRSGMSCAARQW